jgi:hypothetical protein
LIRQAAVCAIAPLSHSGRYGSYPQGEQKGQPPRLYISEMAPPCREGLKVYLPLAEVERKPIPKLKAHMDGQTNPLTAIEQALRKAYESMPRLPDFSVVVWLRKTDEFAALKAELLGAAVTGPYESTEYQGMVDFHWSAPSLLEAQRLVDSLKGVARHPDLVLLRIMSQVDGVDSVSIKDERRTRH